MKLTRLTTAALALAAAPALAQDMAHDKDFWRDGLDQMAETCGFDHTGYVTDQYKAYLQSTMSAGKPPQIFTWWTGNALTDIVSSGLAAPVDEIWDAKIASGEYAAGTRDLFTVDGKTYALPMLLARWVMFYNTEMFAEAGIESEPQSWAELMEAAEKLKAAGHTPFEATVQDGWRGFIWFSEIMIRQNPEAYKGLHDGSVPYDGPEVQAVFDTWVDMYAKGYFTDPRSTEEAEDFARGKAAMYLMGEWAAGTLVDNGMTIGKDLGVFITPNADAGLPAQVIVEGAPILISNDAWDDAEARAAYECWASVDGANKWAEVQSIFNGNLKAKAPNGIVQEVSADMAAGGHLARNRWWEAVPSDLQGDLVAELSAFMLNPTAEKATEVMQNMQAFNQAYWDDQY
ncbi:ABC transporter substrate-binding protein [Mameliella sediminis]|uniref:ABC transporter substrate-binding protein n=1 Tax=Mameliella sediminis TaxID=2836866 RepID=UPI001C4650C0|nr:extracellular solute-binding protein [Mameliella sediminis]MBV7393471.1 extracellular solute-binding protein [Mameliella sediminis]MBY6161129.1 extracellular solute-binding protein [Mameliella alba]MBY6169599.1 extracellular solute-binding protein [Mameliella alba]MBY6174618.1 extracellular solute-binding protein [Mameliella alba]